ncbi:cysteine hydrolase [Streptomyces sp. NPDC127118]|uniref:cysteine hydrolase n=1 Tax=Streptomyces sp. NPDC127118 TaxID=3345369 RepID=UPI003635EC69
MALGLPHQHSGDCDRAADGPAAAQGSAARFHGQSVPPDRWETVPDRNKSFSAVAAAKAMHHEHDATQIHEDIAPHDGDIIVRKIRYGATSTTDLHEQLANRGIDTLILTGISTSGVVLSTLIDVADRDYLVYVLSDGVADRDPEIHQVLVHKVFPTRAHVIDTAGLHDLLHTT